MPAPRLLKFVSLLAITLFFGAMSAPYVSCQEFIEQITEDGRKWRVTADRITYHSETGIYEAFGDVEIIQGQKRLSADKVLLDSSNMTAEASGSVKLTSKGEDLGGSRLEINLETGTGTLYEGFVFITENNFRIKGDRIEKTGENTYHITRGSLTSCEGPNPDWQITGRQVDVTIEGYGYASHAAFWAGPLPMLYVPWFMFPVKLERQTGLLMPRAGYSDRNGAEFTQPFYWAISKNTDATFYYHHIQKRGAKFGVEYRYKLSEDSKGTLMADGFKDRHVDDGSPEATKKWGYDDDSAIRPNDDRYWIRMKTDQQLPFEASARLDLDIVSDQDYLREFSDGLMGYEDTDSYFASEFGRDLDDENDPVRTNRLNINRTWTHQSLNADLVWYDNVIKRRLRDTDDTLQQLPRIQYNALKQPVFENTTGNLLFGTLDSEYTYFYRQDEPASGSNKGDTAHRLDLHPRFYLPLRADPYFSLEPSAGFRQTLWYIDADREFYGEDKDRYLHRELYDIEVDLSTDINRVFSVDRTRIEKVKHVIVPKLSYEYIPETDQSEYPYFDQTDQIDARNRLAMSLTNLFTSKFLSPATGEDEKNNYTYNQFARFFIEQAYSFREQSETGKAWLPLYAELDLKPVKLLNLSADAEWSHQKNALDSANFSCRLHDSRGDELRIEYRYTRNSTKSLQLYGKLRATNKVTLFGKYERNLENEIDIEKGLGLRYESQCWALELSRLEEENDIHYMAMLELTGLGGFGDTLEK